MSGAREWAKRVTNTVIVIVVAVVVDSIDRCDESAVINSQPAPFNYTI